jgi:hypothetical protein
MAMALVAGCGARAELPAIDPGLGMLQLREVHPQLLLPSTEIDLIGDGFADPSRAGVRVRLEGTYTPAGGEAQPIDLVLPAMYVDAQHVSAVADASFLGQLPAPNGHLDATATVLFDSFVDRGSHPTPPLPVALDVADSIAPSLKAVGGGMMHVNDAITLAGDGFLLGTAEGATHALVSGCFLATGAAAGTACTQVTDVDLTALPSTAWSRTQLEFPFAPAIAGIAPGSFAGTVKLENRMASGQVLSTAAQPLSVTLRKPEVTKVSPTEASLGQFVDVEGGGFVGDAADEVTLLHLTGSFQASTAGAPAAQVDLKLVPRFLSGPHVRYVLDETDALGKVLDLRRVSGSFTGEVAPIVRKGDVEVVGPATPVTLAIAPLKQVVYVRFLPSYVDSLRAYGLGGVDADVRKRVLAVAARDYAGVNMEFRSEPPTDFALYSQVDVAGPDPNNLGLLGYDNTPGKDVGNQRLFDRLGGVNASTQSDGFPGYGGVFTEQFLGFSAHPGSQIAKLPTDSPLFDAIFDPLRPDSGLPVSAVEGHAGAVTLGDGTVCPADPRDRQAVIACGVFVLGNLIGSTLTHEIGHSLGLADPEGELFHDPGDEPNRLMDAGDGRPFEERAELAGQGPAVFCDDEFIYLTTILAGAPTSAPAIARPVCD